MLFNSYVFLFSFLPITLLVYYILSSKTAAIYSRIWLLVASFFFYAWWNFSYLFLLIGSLISNYYISKYILKLKQSKKANMAKMIFIVGLLFNISLLGYFKYMDFFIVNINNFLGWNLDLFHLILPLGISFFTIQQIVYLIDVYEGIIERQALKNYSIFVTFFPQLIAGPIVHHKEMIPQFESEQNRAFNIDNFSKGIFIFSIGLFKKSFIADSLALWANYHSSAVAGMQFFESWLVSLSYTFQLYFDFSAYSDMAIGIALMFNIRLPANFLSPYKAKSIIEFWQRWHITLSRFITTYLYTASLRLFSKINFTKAMIATLLAMFISGLWHGAGWTFIIWGTMHGFALVFNHIWKKRKFKMPAILGLLMTFSFVHFSFVIFKARDMTDALGIMKAMLGLNGVILPLSFQQYLGGIEFFTFGLWLGSMWASKSLLFILILLFFFVLRFKNSIELLEEFKPTKKYSWIFIVSLSLGIMSLSKVSDFLYFNF